MYKESRLVNGVYRVLNVLVFVAFVFGEIIIYAITAPQGAYTYTSYATGMVTSVAAKPFQLDDFILYTAGLLFVLWFIYMVIAYVINGFRGREPEG